MPPKFLIQNQGLVLWILAISLLAFLYETITLYHGAFQLTSSQQAREDTSPKLHIYFTSSVKHSVCPVLFSFATTNRISIDFFSCRY